VPDEPPPTSQPAPARPAEPPPDDRETDPVEPPVEVPSGRVVIPSGKIDPGQTRSITFPVAGPVTYVNDFGACRDGCRRAHKGNDIIGDRLQPIIAMHDGVIDHLVDHPTAGYGVVIRDSEGWEYRVYHMNNDTPGTDDAADAGSWRLAPGIVPGASVRAGQFIGWMGDSGNSEGSVPHAHVEIHRPDGAAINPYWSLRLAQRDVNCAASSVPRARLDRVTRAQASGETAAADTATADSAADPAATDPAAPSVGPAGASRPGVAQAAEFLATGWQQVTLPGTWLPLTLTGGRPTTDVVGARMWVGPSGYTPVDAASLQVGDARYERAGDCKAAAMDPIIVPVPAELGAILATIRTLESGGDYTAESRSSSASGAYQFVDGTWGGYGGYARAKDAPPPVQDAAAIDLVNRTLAANNNDVATIPVSWYLGHVPVGAEWDAVPAAPGNVLTPREYQARWLQIYSKYVMSPTFWTSGALGWAPQDPLTCRTVVTDLGAPGDPEYVLTQARAFNVTRDGRAVVRRNDPCDPNRPAPRKAPTGLAELTPAGDN
jgi:hypothetical protein